LNTDASLPDATARHGAGEGGKYDHRPHTTSRPQEAFMSDRTYRVTEIVGTSPESVDAAVRNAVRRAGQTLRHLDWFEITEVRGQIVDGEVAHYQVGLKVGFRLEDS
jgi:flavin-binding protein dodecin